jgi:hypothetical protein
MACMHGSIILFVGSCIYRSSSGCKALLVILEASVVGPEAVASDLAGGAAPNDVAHLDHGGGELGEEGGLVVGEGADDGAGAWVVEEALVGGQHSLPSGEGHEVAVVEGVRRDDVEALLPGRAGGALPCERPGEVLAGSDQGADCLADGVAAGERDEVGGVAEASGGEGAEERVDVAEGAREDAELGRRGRPQAVPAAEGEVVEGPSGEADGVAGGEGEDVGARHRGPAPGVHLGADVLHQLQRRGLQRPVWPGTPLRVQEDGSVAALS